MSKTGYTRTTVPNPALDRQLESLPAVTGPSRLPGSKTEAEALFTDVEARYVPQTRRGRPAKSGRHAVTETHRLSLPPPVWAALVKAAKVRRISTNQAAIQALAHWAGLK